MRMKFLSNSSLDLKPHNSQTLLIVCESLEDKDLAKVTA